MKTGVSPMKAYSIREFASLMHEHGWIETTQGKGSHVTFKKQGFRNIVTIPTSSKSICPPMAKRLLREANILIS
jgi:predicted RNA binding protein YcfA (HicA-like mRNA interferase family)